MESVSRTLDTAELGVRLYAGRSNAGNQPTAEALYQAPELSDDFQADSRSAALACSGAPAIAAAERSHSTTFPLGHSTHQPSPALTQFPEDGTRHPARFSLDRAARARRGKRSVRLHQPEAGAGAAPTLTVILQPLFIQLSRRTLGITRPLLALMEFDKLRVAGRVHADVRPPLSAVTKRS